MSTLEQPAPAIGSPEWYHSRPASVFTTGSIDISRRHVWTDDHGVTNGSARLGAVEVTFHNPQQVRDVIAYLAALAGEMDAEIARQRPPAVLAELPEPEGYPCSACGATAPPKRAGRCNNRVTCAERVAVRDAEAAQVTR